MSRKIIKKSNRYAGVYQYQKGKDKLWGYRLKYYDHTGKRKEKTGSGFADDREAYQHMIDVENNINKGNMHIVNPSKLTFGDMLDIVIEEYKPNKKGVGFWSEGTYNGYLVFKERYAKGTISHIKLSELTADIYRKEFINKFDDISPSTLKLQHTRANAIVNESVEREYIHKNKIKNVKMPQDVKVKESDFLSVDELNSFLEGIDASDKLKKLYKVLFYLLAYSGIRIGEARALNWNDINFKELTINVNKSIDNSNRIGLTKSRKFRIVEVDVSIVNMLKVYKKRLMNNNQFNSNFDYVFKAPGSAMPISYNSILRQTRRLGLKFINKDFSPHAFRHTHASILLMSGQPTKTVAHRLGNTEPTVIRHYSHVIPGITISPVDAFNLKFGGKSGGNNKITHI